jgi:hypothetical protein
MALVPGESWLQFKERLRNEVVDLRAIKEVNVVYLNQCGVKNDHLVPNLTIGKDEILAVVTFGVLLYIYID